MGSGGSSSVVVQQRRRAFAVEVVRTLREAGYQALWAGGCVRDLLIGLVPSDYDVATDATPEQVMRVFRRTIPVGVSFGVVRVLGPKECGEIEVATFRSDGAYIDGRRPESVVYSSPEEDASRRDFTINGMFFDPLSDEIIDFVGGKTDLEAGLLRAIGDPTARFSEDKLRLVRAVRFASRFGLRIEERTQRALEAMAPKVVVVSAERIAQELRRMLVHPSRSAAMRLLMDFGLARAILPELLALVGQSAEIVDRPGLDRWERTLSTLDALPHEPRVGLALAALLCEGGLEAVRTVSTRLKLSNAERDSASWLVEHSRVLLEASTWPVHRLKRLLAAPDIRDLLGLSRAMAEAVGKPADHVDFCERYLIDLPDGPIRPEPLLSGNDLKQLGLLPGPRYKEWLERAYDAQLGGAIGDREQAIAWVERQIAQQRSG